MILDIHSHRLPPYADGVISVSPADFPSSDRFPEQLFSVGFHPWNVTAGFPGPSDMDRLREVASRQEAAAIGECGIDLVKGGMLFLQRKLFAEQAAIAEELGKPLIIHCVRAHDHIIAFRRDLKAKVNWAIHGFRNKDSIARLLLDAGLWLSFGSRFNEEALRNTPLERILAETDEEQRDIREVIATLGAVRPEITPELIATNAARFLTLQER